MSQSLPQIQMPFGATASGDVPEPVLARVQRLYDQGYYLKAYQEALGHGDPSRWSGVRGLVWASRLASNLGAPRLANARALQAFRCARGDAEALFYAAGAVLNGKGPLAALQFVEAHQARIVAASIERRADLVALQARILARFRDFDRALQLMDEAERLCPASPWIFVERSFILRLADRYQESFEAAAQAYSLNARYRPSIQALVQAQKLLGRGDEAYALLTEAARDQESAALWLQLSEWHIERERYAEADAGYAAFKMLSPMMEPAVASWLAGARARVAYLSGAHEQAAAFAGAAGGHYFDTMATRLNATLMVEKTNARRVELAVPFLRQHHMTCAPTCLAMLAHYFKKPADQAAIAAEICYDGTEDHKERHWAESNGYTVKEFTVDWATTVALIDRGLPFCLNTQETASAHLQIVMGYDPVLGLLLIRDPFSHAVGEFLAVEFFERYRHNGPRGMVMVPQNDAKRLEPVLFVDAQLYDERHAMRRAMLTYDRVAAEHALARAAERHAEHWMVLSMRLELARYDSDGKTVLDLTERLYALNPANKRYLHLRLNTLREHARQNIRVAMLEDLVRKPGCDTVFYVQLADELRHNRQRLDEAESLLHRAIAQRPQDGSTYWYLAEIFRQKRQWGEAARLARLAACLDETNEFLAAAYFNAARFVDGGQGEAVAFLRRRFERFGLQSTGPARTLHWALGVAQQTAESFAVLEDALRLRPDDGELLLYAADAYAGHGSHARADDLLKRAADRVLPLSYSEALATIAELRGERRTALRHWQTVAKLCPQALEAHNRIATLLDKMQSRHQAVAYMQGIVAQYPDNRYLRKALVEWLRDHDSPELGAALEGLISVWPQDSWAHRELALYYAGTGRFGLADQALAAAQILDPDSYGFHYARGYVERLRGDLPAAQTAFLAALSRHVDSSHALIQALRSTQTIGERIAIISRFKEMLLAGRTTLGDGLRAFYEQGADYLAPDEMLTALTQMHAAFDHLPEAWANLAQHHLAAHNMDAALEIVGAATARFPLHQLTWLMAASVHRACGDRPSLEDALQKSVAAQPADGHGVRQLAAFYEESGDLDREAAVLVAAIERQPLDAGNLAYLADCLWRRGDKSEAIDRLIASLKIDMRTVGAWDTLVDWTQAHGEPDRAGNVARDLAQKRPDDAWAWTCLARVLRGPKHLSERLAALDHALKQDDELLAAYELKADVLIDAGMMATALDVLRSAELPQDKQQVLLCKEARLLLEANEPAAAASVIAAVLSIEPMHHDGLSLRAEAAQMQGDATDYLKACEALVAFHPQIATSHGFLGDARVRLNDLSGAKAAFARAVDIAPDYEFAAYYLFDLQLEDGEQEAAGVTLALLQTFQAEAPAVVQRQALLAVVRGDWDTLTRALHKLGAAPENEAPRLQKIAAAAVAQGRARAVLPALESLAQHSETRERAALSLVTVCIGGGDYARGLAVLNLPLADGVWATCALALGQALAAAKQLTLFSDMVKTHGRRLHARDDTWASIGLSYGALRRDRDAAQWLADWQSRATVEPLVLYNLSLALRRTGHSDEAGAVNLAGAARGGDDDVALAHALWAAFHAATIGDETTARALLERWSSNSIALNEHDRMVYEMALAALVFARAGATGRGFRQALKGLRALRRWERGPFPQGFYDREFRAGVRRMGETAGQPWAFLGRCEGVLPIF